MPAFGADYDQLTLYVDDRAVQELALPNAATLRACELSIMDLIAKPFLFAGQDLPPIDFKEPFKARGVIGPYTLDVAYYDAEFNPVTRAAKPGRYGAVVTITSPLALPTRRFLTLFCCPKSFDWQPSRIPFDAPGRSWAYAIWGMSADENRTVLARAWRQDRIIGKAHGSRGHKVKWEIPDDTG